MEKERIEIIYKMLINDIELTDENLIKYGYTDEEIDTLILNRIIEPLTNATYKIVLPEKFRQYGVKLLLQKKYTEANTCFIKCYQLNPNSKNIVLQMLMSELCRDNYQVIFDIFANLDKIHPEKYDKDYNLYLYLLSFLTECPEEYINRLKSLTPEDLILPGYGGNKVENSIREAIIKSKFKYAYQLINRIIVRNESYSVKFELIRMLLSKIINSERKEKETITHLVCNKEYQEIVSILTKKQVQSHLNKTETYILLITNAILQIKATHTKPIVTESYKTDMYEALITNNFELAQAINEEFLEFISADKEKDLVNILLVEINQLISDLTNGISTEESTALEEPVYEDTSITSDEESNSYINEIEDMAYYISSINITLNEAKKRFGLFEEQVQLIKLIYARDYYIEGNYPDGDKLLQEVETSKTITPEVIALLNEIKSNRNNYQSTIQTYSRTLTQK